MQEPVFLFIIHTMKHQTLSRFLLLWSLSFVLTHTSQAMDTLRVLAIGNSFSRDAIEYHLSDIAAADGVYIILGNLHIGGCSLERHALNARTDSAAYEYIKIVGGNLTNTPHTRMSTALSDEPWDYVSFQQASHFSGLYDTYEPYLSELTDTVLAHLPKVRQLWHMTWAYATHSTHNAFPYYGKNQMKMYKAILNTCQQVHHNYPKMVIIPTGTAIQNARAYLGDTLNRDGFHLDYVIGRYTAAATWWEILSKKDIRRNGYRPEGITDEQFTACRKAAHKAAIGMDVVRSKK